MISSTSRQLENAHGQLPFVQACRQRGAKLISAGTGLFIASEQTETVRAVIEESDFFFMNKREATAVFGSLESARTAAGKTVFITLGEKGALVIQGDNSSFVPIVPTNELDPTGAGDNFLWRVQPSLTCCKSSIRSSPRDTPPPQCRRR